MTYFKVLCRICLHGRSIYMEPSFGVPSTACTL